MMAELNHTRPAYEMTEEEIEKEKMARRRRILREIIEKGKLFE